MAQKNYNQKHYDQKIKQLLRNFPASIFESCYQMRFVFIQEYANIKLIG